MQLRVSTASVRAALDEPRFTLSLHSDPADLAGPWQQLDQAGAGSLFQSRGWVSTWCAAAASAEGEMPLLVLGRDPRGAPAFLWPMAIRQRLGHGVLEWLGQRHASYNMGLWRPDVIDEMSPAELLGLLRDIARARPGLGRACLVGQPLSWGGLPNPFVRLPGSRVTNHAYDVPLRRDFASLYQQAVSKGSRRKLAKRWRNLERLGMTATIRHAGEPGAVAVLDEFFTQKAQQLAAKGQGHRFGGAAIEDFYRRLASSRLADLDFEVANMEAAGRSLAVSFGVRHWQRFYQLNASIAPGEHQRCSPGLLIAREQIAGHCRRDTRHWDIGPGFGRHKSMWKASELALIETHLAFTARGWPLATLSRTFAGAKSAVRQSERISATVRSLREGAASLSLCRRRSP
jgi:CelD/BcsL family acetyltransferase involved in cellulose biosynthesis